MILLHAKKDHNNAWWWSLKKTPKKQAKEISKSQQSVSLSKIINETLPKQIKK